MSSQLPWQLQPIMHKVSVEQVTLFELPLYKSRLVDETIYYKELCKQPLSNIELARAFILKSLKLRGVIDEAVPDAEISRSIKDDLAVELFELLFHGPDGPPQEIPLEEEAATKKKSTGPKSTGDSSSITPTPKSSKQKTLVDAQ